MILPHVLEREKTGIIRQSYWAVLGVITPIHPREEEEEEEE